MCTRVHGALPSKSFYFSRSLLSVATTFNYTSLKTLENCGEKIANIQITSQVFSLQLNTLNVDQMLLFAVRAALRLLMEKLEQIYSCSGYKTSSN